MINLQCMKGSPTLLQSRTPLPGINIHRLFLYFSFTSFVANLDYYLPPETLAGNTEMHNLFGGIILEVYIPMMLMISLYTTFLECASWWHQYIYKCTNPCTKVSSYLQPYVDRGHHTFYWITPALMRRSTHRYQHI